MKVVGVDTVVEEETKCGCKQSTYFLILLILVNAVLFADQNLLSPVLTPIAREYDWLEYYPNGSVIMEYDENIEEYVEKVDGAKRDLWLGGYITFGFWVIGGIASLTVGYFTDTVNRRNVLCAVVAVGETACLATYFLGGTFWGLFVTRVLTGVAIGGAVPLMFSLFGDLFSVRNRGRAIAAALTAVNLGSGVGQIGSGILAGADGTNWKLAFVVVAVPAYIVIAVILFTVPEPARGVREEAFVDENGNSVVEGEYSEKVTWEKFKALWKTRTVVLIFAQGIPASLPWGVLLGIFTDFLIEDKNIERATSGLVVMAFGLGAAIGAIFGGFIADYFSKRMRFIPLVMGITTSVGALPLIALINLPPQSVGFYMGLSVPSGMIIGITGSAVKVVLVNVCLPETRGSAFAVFNLFDDLGKGGGAVLVSVIVSTLGREKGLTISTLGWIVGSIAHFAMYFTIEKDYAKAQAQLEAIRENRKQLSA